MRDILLLTFDHQQDIWMTKFPDGAKAAGSEIPILELFGTTTLPTPFFLSVDAEIVRRRIQTLDLEYKVRIVGE